MKKIITCILVIAMMVSLAACGGDSSETTTVALQTTTESEAAPATESKAETTNADEQDPTAETTSNAASDSSSGSKIKVPDKSLTGIELLESIEWSQPDSFYYKSDIVSAQGTNHTMEFWMDGDNIRTETIGIDNDQKSIMIYNADEQMTYQYVEGQSTGIAMSDDMEDDEEDLEDMAPLSLSELVSEDDDYDEIHAEIMSNGGEEVVYIELIASEDSVTVRSQFWYSLNNAFLLSSEIYYNDKLSLAQNVIKFDSTAKIDSKMFTPPADVEFDDFSMDDMFGDLDDYMDSEEFDEDMIDFGDIDFEDLGF